MVDDSKLLEVISAWHKLPEKKLFDREVARQIIDLKPQTFKEVIDIIGVRRSGKSSVLGLIIRKLDLKPNEFLFVNFEEPVFIGNYNVELLEQMMEVYKVNFNAGEKPFVFLDEIQLVPAWEKWVRKYRDLLLAHLFVTGSSSALLSREYGTALTGRHLTFTVYPLGFREFLEFNRQKAPENEVELVDNRILLKKQFEKYLELGGFPEVVLTKNRELLKAYFEDILYKDIILRHNIRDPNTLRKIAVFCLTNISSTVSYNSLRQQFKISLDTVRSYLSYLEESFLTFQVPFYSFSLKQQEVLPKKIYCIDHGLRNEVCFRFSKDRGKLLENLVFLELKRQKQEVFYWKNQNGKEVDFLTREKGKLTNAIQVCAELNNKKTEERELAGLLSALKQFKLKKGTILTTNTEKTQKIGNKTIAYTPLWKWLIQPSQHKH